MSMVEIRTKLEKLFKYRFSFELIREWGDENIIDGLVFKVQTYEIIIKEKEKIPFSFFMKQLISFIKYLQSIHTTKDEGFHVNSEYMIKLQGMKDDVPSTSFNVNYAEGNFVVKYNGYNYDDIFLKKYFPAIILEASHFYNIGAKIDYDFEEEEDKCIICRSNFPNILFDRYQHNVACEDCFNKLDINNNNPVKCLKCGVENLIVLVFRKKL